MYAGHLAAESVERNYAVIRNRGETCCYRSAVQKEYWYLTPGGRRIECGRVHILLQQNRQVLGYGVSEVRAEHADVIASPISHAYNGFRSQLVRNTEAGRECRVGFVDVPVQSDFAEPGYADSAGSAEIGDIGEAAVSFRIN